MKLGGLQEAEDNYYLTANYLLQLANRAYDLFIGSEHDQKRQILKLILLNPILKGKRLCYDLIKPFDTVLNFADNNEWLRIVNNVRTIIERQNEYVYVPDLRGYFNL